MITFKARGDKKILRQLKGLTPKIQKRVISRAARSAMRPVLAAAKSNAPRKTGQLVKSLKLRALRKNRRGNIGIMLATSKKWFVGKEFYAAFQEFGWKTGKRQPTTDETAPRRPIEGKHFVEQAYKSHGPGALRAFITQVQIEIDRIAKGG